MANLKKVPEEVVAVKEISTAGKPESTTVKFGEYNLQIVRDWDGKVDPFYLPKKDPNYAYRFIRDDNKFGGKNISIKTSNLLFDKGGWQICPKEHLFRLGIKENELTQEGYYRRGDTILAFMPKSLFNEKIAYKEKEAKLRINTIRRVVGTPGKEGTGIPSEGIMTKKELGMK